MTPAERKAIEKVGCPWTACCIEHEHPGRDGTRGFRPCWKAKLLGWKFQGRQEGPSAAADEPQRAKGGETLGSRFGLR